jgi:transposase InsO family protein
MSTSSSPLSQTERQAQVALERYTLILPLLRAGSAKERHQLRKQLVAHPPPPFKRLSLTTLYRWEKAWAQGGFEALKPQPRREKSTTRAISPATLDRAEALKREQPFRSARAIINMLTLDRDNPIPEAKLAERTLRRQLVKRGATSAQLLAEQRPKPYRRFERHAFGDLWQGDALHGPKLPDPAQPDQLRPTFLFAFIDDHTRLVPHAQFYWHEQLPRLEDCFHKAIRRYGLPLAVYVDRGAVYTARQFDTACATLGIQRILATAYYPEGKGKIERFFRFVRSDFLPELERSNITSLNQLNESLLAWLEVVYHRKPHKELGQSPLQRYQHNPNPAARTVAPELLHQAFLHRVERQVTKTATVSFLGNRYHVPAFLRGQKVQLRYDPLDLTRLEIWHRDQFLELATPEIIVASHHPEATPDPVPTPAADPSLDYLALLRLERQRLLEASLGGINFSQLTLPGQMAQTNPQEAPDVPA